MDFYDTIYMGDTMNQLEMYIKNNTNKVIALDGPSGSGKSTFSKYLEEHYDVLVFHTDDYFLPKKRKTESRLNEPGGNLDYERMEEEIFKQLKENNITSHYFNCQTEKMEYREPVKRKSIILIEGVYSMHPNFQKYYDIMVYSYVDRETQLDRILRRSNAFVLERFKTEWIPLEDKYFEEFTIPMKASYIIEFS